jgi:hypothetical protein
VNGSTITFSPGLNYESDYRITLPTSIKDSFGQHLALERKKVFHTHPAPFAVGKMYKNVSDTSASPSISFSNNLDCNSLAGNITSSSGTVFSFYCQNKTIYFTLNNLVPNTTHSLKVSGNIQNASGAILGSDVTLNFTTTQTKTIPEGNSGKTNTLSGSTQSTKDSQNKATNDENAQKQALQNAADPIDVSKGAFTYNNSLLALKNIGVPYIFSVNYNNQVNVDTSLGKTFSHNMGSKILATSATSGYFSSDGLLLAPFDVSVNSYQVQYKHSIEYIENNNTFKVTSKDKTVIYSEIIADSGEYFPTQEIDTF